MHPEQRDSGGWGEQNFGTHMERKTAVWNKSGQTERFFKFCHGSPSHSPEIFLSSDINFRSARLILVW